MCRSNAAAITRRPRRDADTEFYGPCPWFATTYGTQPHPIDEVESFDAPEWR